MQIRPRFMARAGIVAGLALTAFPMVHTSIGATQRVHAMPMPVEVAGFSQALLAQAAARPQPMIVTLRLGGAQEMARVIATLRAKGATNIAALPIIDGIAATMPASALEAVRYDTLIGAVQPDRQLQPLPNPYGDMLQSQLAHVQLHMNAQAPLTQTVVSEPDTLSIIHADAAQKLYNGRDIRVAIIDSGIDLSHPDLQGVMLKGPDGKPLYKDFTNTDLTDTVGHGTACAGVIASQGKTVYSASDTYRSRVYPAAKPGQRFNDKTYFTFTGVAPGVKLMAAKIFDTRQSATDSGFARAIQWAIDNHADVISESWGQSLPLVFNGNDASVRADEAAVAHGITVVVSAGNAGPGAATSSPPSTSPSVISVGASTDYRQFAETGEFANFGAYGSDSIAAFTGRGPTLDGRMRPDVYAPGDSSWATFPIKGSEDNNVPPYAIGSFAGTSMAAPVTTGTVAIVINAYRETHGGASPSPAKVKQILLSSADDLGYAAQDQAAGRINALRAVQAVTHRGAAVLVPGAISLSGAPGQSYTQPITITNSGSVPERVTIKTEIPKVAQHLAFNGTVVADNQVVYHFNVPAGINSLTAAINFNSQLTVPLPGEPAKNVIMQITLYDPNGKLINFEQSTSPSGISTPVLSSGYTATTAGRPTPGLWTATILQAPRRDRHEVRHLINLPFTGQVTMYRFKADRSTVTPATVTVNPGQTARVQFRAGGISTPGITAITLHLAETNLAAAQSATAKPAADPAPVTTTATLPVLITTAIAMHSGVGFFSGAFTGGVGSQGYASEYHYFNFNVPAGVSDLQVSMRWQHRGNLFLMTLIDPNGKIVNVVDNALPNSDGTTNLNYPTLDNFLSKPIPGTWRLGLLSLVGAGVAPSEPFRGVIVLNQHPVQQDTTAVTARSGGSPASFKVRVKNNGLGIEAYYSYATSDQFAFLPLGGTGGTLQDGVALGVGATQVLTYTTSFVPPGTREVVTQAQALNSTQPIGIELFDSLYATYNATGRPSLLALAGHAAPGYTALLQGDNLPIGQYFVEVSLPLGQKAGQVYVASNTQAYALAPQPWIKLDAQRQIDGTLSQNLLVAAPGASATFQGHVSVPDSVAPGTYHAHIFIYNFRDDRIADLPLTITVQPSEPAPAATPDPLLAAITSTQYFPEGATATGLSDTMDLVNPGPVAAHVQLRLLNDGGWTTITRYALPAHSRKSVDVQPLVGLSQSVAAVVQADEPVYSGRQITRIGAAGSYSVGTVEPSSHWYFADGYTVGSFQAYLAIVNPSAKTAHIHLHLVSDQDDTRDSNFTVGGSSRRTIQLSDLLPGKALSASLTSDVAIVAERTQQFGSLGQGVTTTIGTANPAAALYIDPGHLPKGSQAHFSLYNPTSTAATVKLALINQHGDTTNTITLHMPAGRRATLDLTARYKTADLGASITSSVPIVAEKVIYYGQFKQGNVGGADLAAIAVPVSHAVFPGGTTAHGSTDYLNLYNPGDTALSVTVTSLFGKGRMAQHSLDVPAKHRISVGVASLGVPAGASSLIVDAARNGTFFASQSMFNQGGTDGSEVNGITGAGQ